MSSRFHPLTNIGQTSPGFDNEPVPVSNESNQPQATQQEEEVEDGHSTTTTTAPNTSGGRRKKRRVNVEEEEDIVSRLHTYVSQTNGVLTVRDPVDLDPVWLSGIMSSVDSLLNQGFDDFEWSEARKKISSLLLEIGFPALLDLSKEAAEIGALASKLSNDPSLSPEKSSFLKLMESLPMMSQEFQANKAIMEEADTFFNSQEVNKHKVTLLVKELEDLGHSLLSIKMEVKEKLEEIRKIDELIAPLQAKKSALMKSLENKEAEEVSVSYGHKMVANSMTNMVRDVQKANQEKSEWERKKEIAQKSAEDILSKATPFNGFFSL